MAFGSPYNAAPYNTRAYNNRIYGEGTVALGITLRASVTLTITLV